MNDNNHLNDDKKVTLIEDDKGQIKDLAEQEVLSNNIVILFAIYTALALGIFAHAGISIVSMLRDKSIPVVVCPYSYELDAPVVMKTISKSGPKAIDRWIRGFMRRYIIYQFPRQGAEAKAFFTYIQRHSTGAVQTKYQELLDEIKEISTFIDSGYYYKFYPTDSTAMRISAHESQKNTWTVEIDGYLVKKMGGKEERFNPMLKYIIVAGEANLENPEGLYVIDANLEQITDYVSGNKQSL